MPPPSGRVTAGVAVFVTVMSVFGGGGVVGGCVGGVFWVIEFVTVTATAVACVPFVIVAGLPDTDGVPNVQPLGAEGSAGSLTVHCVPVSNGPTVVDSPPCNETDCAAAEPHVYEIVNVPVNPDDFASNTLLIFR